MLLMILHHNIKMIEGAPLPRQNYDYDSLVFYPIAARNLIGRLELWNMMGVVDRISARAALARAG